MNRVCVLAKVVCYSFIFSPTVNKMNLGISSGLSTSGVDMVPSEISTNIQSILNWKVCKILISKGFNLSIIRFTALNIYLTNNFLLSHKQSKLIFAFIRQLA